MDPRLVALYNHWCHADAIRVFVHQPVPEAERDQDLPPEMIELAEFSSSMSRIVVWYSLLYVVIEGYAELGMNDDNVDAVLENEEMVSYLRRFRNSVFHYQPELMPKKHLEFLAADGSEVWARSLNRALDRFFLANLPIKEQIDALKVHAT